MPQKECPSFVLFVTKSKLARSVKNSLSAGQFTMLGQLTQRPFSSRILLPAPVIYPLFLRDPFRLADF